MNKLYLSPLVHVFKKNNMIYLCEDDIYTFEYNEALYNALIMLKEEGKYDDIKKQLGDKSAKELVACLREIGFIKSSNSNEYKGTFIEKQIEYLYSLSEDGNVVQRNIENSTIAIVGVGGIGSVVIQHLVAAGVNSFILIDGDIVDIDNFNRQLIYTFNQIGKNKVECAKNYILKINPRAEIKTYLKYINNVDDLKMLDDYKIDFMICGADRPYRVIQEIISDYCWNRKIPSSYGAVGINYGNWGPLIVPFKDTKYKIYQQNCNNRMSADEKAVYENISKKPLKASFGITNTIVATLLSYDVIKYIAGISVESGVVYSIDFRTLEVVKEYANNENKDK